MPQSEKEVNGVQVDSSGKITTEDLYALVEERRNTVGAWMNGLTLNTVGKLQLEGRRDFSNPRSHTVDAISLIQDDDPRIEFDSLELDTQGFYPDAECRNIDYRNVPGTFVFWGLSRRKRWLLVKVVFDCLHNPAPCISSRNVVKLVSIHEVELKRLVENLIPHRRQNVSICGKVITGTPERIVLLSIWQGFEQSINYHVNQIHYRAHNALARYNELSNHTATIARAF